MEFQLLIVHESASNAPKERNLKPALCIKKLLFECKVSTKWIAYLSRVSASRYALRTNHAINARSPSSITQLRKVDHEKIRWTTKITVNTRADCHA